MSAPDPRRPVVASALKLPQTAYLDGNNWLHEFNPISERIVDIDAMESFERLVVYDSVTGGLDRLN